MGINVRGIPAFSDNYLWLLDDGQHAVVVDPGDDAPVRAVLSERNLSLQAILITHHHFDHTGGVDALLADHDIPVFGPQDPRIPQVSNPVSHGEQCTVLGLTADVIEVPGHTTEHIAYFFANGSDTPLLFCGDTLFAGGCGRLFEGSPAQMRHSLSQLASLPANTNIYCAHEYTQANLRFASAVEPNNLALQQRVKSVDAARSAGQATVPSRLAEEIATNPFLRWNQASVKAAAANQRNCAASTLNDDEVFAAIREWKDSF